MIFLKQLCGMLGCIFGSGSGHCMTARLQSPSGFPFCSLTPGHSGFVTTGWTPGQGAGGILPVAVSTPSQAQLLLQHNARGGEMTPLLTVVYMLLSTPCPGCPCSHQTAMHTKPDQPSCHCKLEEAAALPTELKLRWERFLRSAEPFSSYLCTSYHCSLTLFHEKERVRFKKNRQDSRK